MNQIAKITNEVASRPAYRGDMLVAFLWNQSAAMLGRTDIPATGPVSEDDLRQSIAVITDRPQYIKCADLQALRAL